MCKKQIELDLPSLEEPSSKKSHEILIPSHATNNLLWRDRMWD